jgi:septal ring factor EnvC (AmiA/AmiB activator)
MIFPQNSLEARLANIQSAIEKLIDDYKYELDLSEKENKRLEDEIVALKADNLSLEDDITELENENARLEAELEPPETDPR